MNLKNFFTSTFFAAIIAISAILVVYTYFRIFHFRFSEEFKRRFMEKKIKNLKDHFIVCGFGRVGSQIAEELKEEKVPFVVIDRDPEKARRCQDEDFLSIQGDAAIGEETLKKAQIEKAKGLIIAIGQDADAVFVAVTAKSLNPQVFVVARASTRETASKLEKVGVERVALPYQIGGYHMAQLALRPGVVDFLDVIISSKHQEMVVEEIEVKPESILVNKELATYLSRKKANAIILAIKRPDQSCLLNPTSDVVLKTNDKLIFLGTKEQIEAVKKVVET